MKVYKDFNSCYWIYTGKKLPLWKLIKRSGTTVWEIRNLTSFLIDSKRDIYGIDKYDLLAVEGVIERALNDRCFRDFLHRKGYIRRLGSLPTLRELCERYLLWKLF